jgi:hypothetical protein
MASVSVGALRRKLRSVWPLLDERARRLTAASEAMALPYGGVSLVAFGAEARGEDHLQRAIPVCWLRWTV